MILLKSGAALKAHFKPATLIADLPENMAPLNRMLYLEGKYFLADHNLNYTDKMGMAGVEIRVPLLDPDLSIKQIRLPQFGNLLKKSDFM